MAHQLLNAHKGHASACAVHPEGVSQVMQADLVETCPAARRLEGTLRPLVPGEVAWEDRIRRAGRVGQSVTG
jgi:hypothetical protein